MSAKLLDLTNYECAADEIPRLLKVAVQVRHAKSLYGRLKVWL